MIPNFVMSLLGKIMPGANLQGVNTPDDMAQFLMNSGKVNQSQVNQARQMWMNPQIQQQVNSAMGMGNVPMSQQMIQNPTQHPMR